MLRSLYALAGSMLTSRKKMDVITNNIANIDTTGFKRDRLITRSFDDMLLVNMNDPNIKRIGALNTGVYADEINTNFNTGIIKQTDRSLDAAINGDGFFVVADDTGEYYTRDGSFMINAGGYLTTSDGFYVMGENGPIMVGSDEPVIDSKGNIVVSGNFMGRLRIVSLDTQGIRKIGGNLYANLYGPEPVDDTQSAVMQGHLEASNVSIADEVIDMMTVYRKYETCQKLIQIVDQTLGKAVNEVGRV